MNVNEYLSRINITKTEEPSYSFLKTLQINHLYSIPFEDLDIPDRAKIILDLKTIYNKIILNNRGGFCYELNGMFHWLLTELGFNVDMLSARVFNHDKKELGPEYDHMALIVHLEKDFLVDVGFGDSFRAPIELPNGKITDVSGDYRIVENDSACYELQKFIDGIWNLQYSFMLTPQTLSNYSAMCEFQQNNPASHFRTRMLCTIATPAGRKTLSNQSFTITESGIKTKIDFIDPSEFNKLLLQHFNIVLK